MTSPLNGAVRGNVVPFPVKRQPAEDAVWFSGGSLHIRDGARVHHLEPHFAEERREFWREKAVEAVHADDMAAARHATRRWQAFTTALDALDAHECAMGRRRTPTPTHGDRP